MNCRFCGTPLAHTFVDLGMSPLANAFVAETGLSRAESFYPLHAYVCTHCFLVQLPQVETPATIFSDYVYFSSYSDTWLRHAEAYTAQMIERFNFRADQLVVEVASNDGYLLQYFHQHQIPVLGIEPAANVAQTAIQKGIPTLAEFFGKACATRLAGEGKQADLLIGNNVLAHVPDINDFVAGIQTLLKPDGICTLEFPHVLQLMRNNQFDTIYHEHFSYLSFLSVEKIFAAHGLTVFDVEQLPTHGGSLRIYGCQRSAGRAQTQQVTALKAMEHNAGLDDPGAYQDFAAQVKAAKRDILRFLINAKNAGHSVAGYGAAAKGNTLFNYCGIRGDFVDYVADRSPHKQGMYLPGSRIPVVAPEHLRTNPPDYLLIIPWNLRDEISRQLDFVREEGGRFVTLIPEVEVFP